MCLSVKLVSAGIVLAAIVGAGMSIGSPSVYASDEFNRAQDEHQMIQTGLSVATTAGIQLTIGNRDPDMVGLGSYLVNVVADCNGCHSNPKTTFAAAGNPYFLPGTTPPLFTGAKQINPATYLGGNQSFGFFGKGPQAEIISRNLTPDKTGLPVGGLILSDFMTILKTGVDIDHIHPSCSTNVTNNCLTFPFNGDLLQVMPWTAFQRMTDRQLTAIYTYLGTIPCLEGGPNEPANRCN